jgi:hypothetical protein
MRYTRRGQRDQTREGKSSHVWRSREGNWVSRLSFVAFCALILGIGSYLVLAASVRLLANTHIGPDFGDFYAAARALALGPHTANIYDLHVTMRALLPDPICRKSPYYYGNLG